MIQGHNNYVDLNIDINVNLNTYKHGHDHITVDRNVEITWLTMQNTTATLYKLNMGKYINTLTL